MRKMFDSKSTEVTTSCWAPFVFFPHPNQVSSLNSAGSPTGNQNMHCSPSPAMTDDSNTLQQKTPCSRLSQSWIKIMLETEATLVIIMYTSNHIYNRWGEVKVLWFVLNWFWGMPWATVLTKCTDADKLLFAPNFSLSQLLECLSEKHENAINQAEFLCSSLPFW